VKGKVAMRLEIWRHKKKLHKYAKHAAAKAALELRTTQQSKGAALQQLKQIMVRLVKGKVAMRLEIWRHKKKLHKYAKHAAAKAALELRLLEQSQSVALKGFKQITTRMLKGDAWMRFSIWRDTWRSEKQEYEIDTLMSHLENRAVRERQEAALHQLKQILDRLAKCQASFGLEVWRQKKKTTVYQAHVKEKTQLACDLRETKKRAGLKQVLQILTRLSKRSLGHKVLLWTSEMRKEKAAVALSDLRVTLEAKAADASKGAGLRQLQQVFVRLTKGEVCMRLVIWRQLLNIDTYNILEVRRASLQEKMCSDRKGSGLRQLVQIMVRMTKGEMAMRIMIWLQTMRIEAFNQIEMMRADRRNAGIKALKQVMIRQTKGKIQAKILSWHTQYYDDVNKGAMAQLRDEYELLVKMYNAHRGEKKTKKKDKAPE